jgi:hypothetical protein
LRHAPQEESVILNIESFELGQIARSSQVGVENVAGVLREMKRLLFSRPTTNNEVFSHTSDRLEACDFIKHIRHADKAKAARLEAEDQ